MTKGTVSSGLIIVDKPAGITSHDVVARMRKIVGTRKIGHAGTLDPMATGILVLGVEKATKLLGYVMGHDKTYAATVRLGERTTTDDREGETVDRTDASGLTEQQIRDAFATQVGRISQVPSAVSAIKVAGRRAYDLVREGVQVDLAAREVDVHAINVSRIELGAVADVDITVRCSAGTYIRAIARDAGDRLGVGGHLTALRRTASGAVDESVALTLEQIADLDDPVAVPLDEAVRRTFAVRALTAEQARELSFGRAIGGDGGADEGLGAVAPDGRAIALVDGRGKPRVVFAPA
ncbi:tRNA pseudouridine(55) synthase TruB [Blastococcus sp. Marseille-P5729]|uniref:tRNA pseudouridine(55) synthase TruB n=1 Tax=Blastococcus sp. Marseille-P5729 TaxID=2086582 RepID=UPI000D0E949B|nr:tRNA pseudouridine(55) synthase TruB [Blastococcus sp. Marseille-P5729]